MIENYIQVGLRFLFLVLLQTLVLNHMHLFGFLNPIIYLLFLLVLPIYDKQTLFIFMGFLVGLSVDVMSQGGGAHTLATLTICFIRPVIGMVFFNTRSKVPGMTIHDETRPQNKIIFVAVFVSLHHLLYFLAVYFNTGNMMIVLKNTLLTSLFSFTLLWASLSFFKPKK